MKTAFHLFRYLSIILVWMASQSPMLFAQITIHSSDMPQLGDTLRVSLSAMVPQGYEQTGTGMNWDFASLEAQTQRLDSFINPNATPTAYYIFFGLLSGANLASPLSDLPGLPFTDGFNFYKKDNSAYSDLGLAYRTADIPIIPAKYDTPDKYYQFPMTYGQTWSSNAGFTLSLPGTGYISRQKNRTSEVDGWGTLTTPFGSFQTLRVKSIIAEHDSIYIDSLGLGYGLDRTITEYKWLGNNQGIPLLQVTEEGPLVTATYRDFYRMPFQPLSVTLDPDTTIFQGDTITLAAKASGGLQPYQYLWSTLDTGKTLTITPDATQTYTVLVIDSQLNAGFAQQTVTVDFPSGIDPKTESLFTIHPNPAEDQTFLRFLPGMEPITLNLCNTSGQRVKTFSIEHPGTTFCLDLSGFSPGPYLLQIVTSGKITSTRVLIVKN